MNAGKTPANIFSQDKKTPSVRPVSRENNPNNSQTGLSVANKAPQPADRPPLRNPQGKRSRLSRPDGFFKENAIDNYFTDLHQRLPDSNKRERVKGEVITSISLKQWLREGLNDFQANKTRTELYEREYKGKPYLSLTVEELGFGRATLSGHSAKIDALLAKVVEVMVAELGTNPWMSAKILRRLFRQGKFYPSLY
jgi:hypothetical protein